MKKQVKEDVLEFMTEEDTSSMSSNEFIIQFLWRKCLDRTAYEEYSHCSLEEELRYWPSVESILRSRRQVIADYWIWERTKADSEEEYIEEFARKDKIHVID